MEMIARTLALDTEAARVKGSTLKAALDFLADSLVFELNLMRDRDALTDELLHRRSLRVREVEVKDHPATIGAERQDKVRVHHAGVQVEHEVRIHPPVIGRLTSADLPD